MSRVASTTGSANGKNIESILITNCDNAWGAACCRELLTGKHRENFPFVKAGVQDVAAAGDLWLNGACIVQLNPSTEREWKRHFENVKTMLLVPGCGRPDMVQQAEKYLQIAKQSNVENCLLLSQMGIDEADNQTARKFQEIEKQARQSGIKNVCIVRVGVLQNCMLAFAPMMMRDKKLQLPLSDQAKWAPVNICDVTMFVAVMLAEKTEIAKNAGQVFKLTGSELITPRHFIDTCNKLLNEKIEFEQVDRKHTQHYLQHEIGLNSELTAEALDVLHMISQGKLGHVSQDKKKKTGEDPVTIEKFIKHNALHFRPPTGRGM